MPPLWIMILAAVGIFIAGATSGTIVTTKIKNGEIASINLRHTTALAKQADDANKILLASKDAALEQQKKAQAAFNELEAKYNADQEKLRGTRIANGRLVAQLGGLYDRNGRAESRPSGGDHVSDLAGPAAGTSEVAPGCRLSDAVAQDLLDLAADADANTVTANLGIGLAAKLKELVH